MPSKSKKSSAVHESRPIQAKNPSPVPVTSKISGNGTASTDLANGYPSASQVEVDLRTGDTTESAGEPTPTPTVNRKKQKRREKEAAKRQAEQQLVNGHSVNSIDGAEPIPAVKHGRGPVKGYFTEEPDYVDEDFQDDMAEPEDAFFSGDEDGNYPHEYVEDPNNSWLNTSKRKKGSKARHNHSSHVPSSRTSSGVVRPHIPTISNAAIRSAHKMSSERIWNTSTQAERENIKQFWLELGEEERRSLVKVEKEAVLRKMKEQQKHSCSCSVCGRKRTAIEEELEVLYDAYYEELEQFANHNNSTPNSPHVMPPPRAYRPYRSQAHPMAGSYPVTGRIRELGENGEELEDDDEYDEEEDEEPYSDEDFEDDMPPGPPDFFQFGNSLTVKDGILTVADDLLKNDGKHFIDMMEQLAERRMQREEEIHYPAPPLAHQNMRQGHNHPPMDEEDDYDDDEEDDDYDSQDEDDFEGDEMDSMTEEQRMEEGRRMFQIFAARMFEQRVLTAYREKVAAERQRKLLEELDEESRLDTQREAKKAKEAAKKKEKKARQKAAKEEEKARKDAEKAAQEAETKAAEEKKQEEQRKRKDEQRKKREAERKAAEDDRLRKEAEKQKRLQEEKERQIENERKQREIRERDKKKREEIRKKEKEERDAKEKETKKRQKEDFERKAKDEQLKAAQRAEIQRIEKEAKSKQEAARPQPIALPPGLQHPSMRNPSGPSPHLSVATPLVPASVPTPGRSRQASQPSQQSRSSSPRSQRASTEASQASISPASAAQSFPPAVGTTSKAPGQPPVLHHPQPSAPRSPLNNMGRGTHFPYQMNGAPGLGMNGPPPGPGMMHGMVPMMPMYQGMPMANPQRFGPNNMNYPPPGFGGPRPFQHSQPMPYQHPHPIAGPIAGPIGPPPAPVGKPPGHSRQPSNSEHQAPIARPGPIARPSSATPDKQKPDAEIDKITTQLGSKALLDDSDEPIPSSLETRTNLPPVGAPGSGRMPFATHFGEPNRGAFGGSNAANSWNGLGPNIQGGNWGPPGMRNNTGWPQQPFGGIGGGPAHVPRSHAPRPIAVRRWLVQACQSLAGIGGTKPDHFFPVDAVLQQVNNLNIPGDPPVIKDELLQMCDTEGNIQNGGGSFEVIREKNGEQFVRFIEDGASGPPRASAGDIGSPLPSHSPHQPAPFGSIGQSFGPPGRHF